MSVYFGTYWAAGPMFVLVAVKHADPKEDAASDSSMDSGPLEITLKRGKDSKNLNRRITSGAQRKIDMVGLKRNASPDASNLGSEPESKQSRTRNKKSKGSRQSASKSKVSKGVTPKRSAKTAKKAKVPTSEDTSDDNEIKEVKEDPIDSIE
ncbi:hypothetical protein C0992_007898 [Termitomyces sp. T32_za158]|nr:hypothetical protein C0992_007898 [Termitomyces sp. T32_za158]